MKYIHTLTCERYTPIAKLNKQLLKFFSVKQNLDQMKIKERNTSKIHQRLEGVSKME